MFGAINSHFVINKIISENHFSSRKCISKKQQLCFSAVFRFKAAFHEEIKLPELICLKPRLELSSVLRCISELLHLILVI